MTVEKKDNVSEIINNVAAEENKTQPKNTTLIVDKSLAEEVDKMTVDRSYIEELRQEAAKYRQSKKEAAATVEKTLLDNQQYKALAEDYKTKLLDYEKKTSELSDNLQSIEKLANNWKEHEKRLDAEVLKLSENITDEDKSILSAIGDVSKRKDFLLRISTANNNKITAPDLGKPVSIIDNIKPKKRSMF